MIDKGPPTAAGIVFSLDIFYYVSAGINIILKHPIFGDEYNEIVNQSSPFGIEPDIKYVKENFSINDIDK